MLCSTALFYNRTALRCLDSLFRILLYQHRLQNGNDDVRVRLPADSSCIAYVSFSLTFPIRPSRENTINVDIEHTNAADRIVLFIASYCTQAKMNIYMYMHGDVMQQLATRCCPPLLFTSYLPRRQVVPCDAE
jgi:hypothetical protein